MRRLVKPTKEIVFVEHVVTVNLAAMATMQ